MSPLILFYIGSHSDHRGRYLSEILAQDDLWLEATHDYIQWLFPNKIPSRVTPDAPCLDSNTIQLFRTDDIFQQHLQASLQRLLCFYGLQLKGNKLVKADNWDERKTNWFTEDTHNNLRITRILLCLKECGFSNQAEHICNGLMRLQKTEPDCGIGEKALQFWKEAIG